MLLADLFPYKLHISFPFSPKEVHVLHEVPAGVNFSEWLP